MTSVDVALFGIALISAVIGLYRGLIKELLSLLIWMAAFLLALILAEDVAQALFGWLEQRAVAMVLAFLLVFVLAILAGALLQWFAGRLVGASGLSGSDRFLGFLFGGARGVVVIMVGLIALRPFLEDYAWWQGSAVISQLLLFEEDVLALIERVGEFVSGLTTAV